MKYERLSLAIVLKQNYGNFSDLTRYNFYGMYHKVFRRRSVFRIQFYKTFIYYKTEGNSKSHFDFDFVL